MARRARSSLVLAALAASVLGATRARADPLPLRIDYQASQGCPGADVFLDEIRWRTVLARTAAPGEEALEVRARITRRGSASSGHLVLGQGRDRIVRDLDGESCDEVVSALALVTALAVDPHASTAAKPPPSPPVVGVVPAPPAPPAPPASAPPPATSPPVPPDILAEPLPVIPELPASTRWVLGARTVADFAVTPRPLLGGGLFAERPFESWWRPSLRLSLAVGGTGGFDAGPGGVWFLRAVGRVEGCGFEWRPASWLSFAPCVGVEGGAIHAEGILRGSLSYVRQTTSFWAGGSVLPRLGIDLGPLALDLQGGPIFPMVRTDFVFQVSQSSRYAIWSLPGVTWTAALGLGVHFP